MSRDDVVFEQSEVVLGHLLKYLLIHELDRTLLKVGHFSNLWGLKWPIWPGFCRFVFVFFLTELHSSFRFRRKKFDKLSTFNLIIIIFKK